MFADILLVLLILGLAGDVLEFFLMSFFLGEQLVDCIRVVFVICDYNQ